VKLLAWVLAFVTLIAAAVYMVVSLNRWEWNRALFFGLIFLMAEVALATAIVLRRIARLSVDQEIGDILRETRPPAPNRFAWLSDSAGQLNVFITFLVGGGVLLSGIAWLVDRIAAATASPLGERRLGHQLDAISYPRGGLLVDDVTVLAQDVPGADDAQIHRLLGRSGYRT
jgi:hypothetical protein